MFQIAIVAPDQDALLAAIEELQWLATEHRMPADETYTDDAWTMRVLTD